MAKYLVINTVPVEPHSGETRQTWACAGLLLSFNVGAAEPEENADLRAEVEAIAVLLKEQGYTEVSNLEGSIFEWANQGLPVVRDDQEVGDVHPNSRRWQGLLDQELRANSVE